ncbi:hypothetical protein PFICI_10022 [Pestalotiopsis fici W106-1]|uniref:C3H1-type domain-containing protein n=1 Tax=Pestalotiopsis fici (strain W106-1 / CGMCC3.15140) TaxID=1229662 RepID=W3WVS8_PESFW|nr:uncharacterized protein PFICI_10022 [Pestalotiopsis fici W106-1]ETS77960.1 hypothetical protein PFICI_10022 [Pestalotiopsis fici W106-1]
MDTQRDAMVTRGLTQLHTGLGILLGAGRISTATHEQILALINNNDDNPNASNAGKETPISLVSNGLDNSFDNLKITNKPPRGPSASISSASPLFPRENAWRTQPSLTPAPKEVHPEPRRSNVVCPWFWTPGYTCREKEKGMCAWLHEDCSDGVKDPLICAFWADGERCTKSAEDCRFAHYWAAHREIAPQPGPKYNPKYKKSKKFSTSSNNDAFSKYSEAGAGTLLD